MTSLPAVRMGLQDVGRLALGLPAGLVVFDPRAVADNTAPGKADAALSGIRLVMISGQVVVKDGKAVPGLRPGRVLRN